MRFLEAEHRLAAETNIKYKGTASVELEALTFAYEADEENVTRLKAFFKKNGCNRLDIRNHVPAVISQEQLDIAIRYSETTAKALMSSPRTHPRDSYVELRFPANFRLECLHGSDRVRAASEILPPADKHWIVDLYLEDLSHDLRTTLVEEYSCEKEPDDGEFYYKIRQYQKSQNVYFEERWWARLSSTSNRKAKNLKRLLNNPDFRTAFDCQLEIPGLRKGMRLGTLHTMFAMKCDEENLRYLDHIKSTWSRIVHGDGRAMQKIGRATVKALEHTAPGACRADSRTILRQVRSGQILAGFPEREREAIWNEIMSVSTDRLIPSLFTFFEDINYLQRLADCIKQLVYLSDEDCLSDAIRKHYSGIDQAENQYITQDSEFRFVSRPGGLNDRIEFGMRQIWAAAGRKYVAIPVQRKKAKQDLLAKPIASSSEAVLCEFAALAYKLGFDSKRIRALRHRSTDREMARNVLLEARKPDRYRYDATALEMYVEQIVGFFCTAREVTEKTRTAFQDDDYSTKSPRRCGIPRTQDYEQEQCLLFLHNLSDHKREDRSEQLSPFFIRRSVFIAFFGDPHMSQQPVIEQERYRQEALQRQHIEREKLERGRLDRESLKQERLQQEKLEQEERLEQEELKREKLVQARLQQERLEQERLQQERLQQERLEQERLEQERLQQERLEQERLQQERLEQERAEQQRLEQEGLAKAKKTRLSEDTVADDTRFRPLEGLSRKQQATSSDNAGNRATQINLDHVKALQNQSGKNQVATNLQSTMPLNDGRTSGTKVRINFVIKERDIEKITDTIEVDPLNPSQVGRVALKYVRKGFNMTNTKGQVLQPQTCFEDVTADGTNTILLIPRSSTIDTDELVHARTSKRPAKSVTITEKQEHVPRPKVPFNDVGIDVQRPSAGPVDKPGSPLPPIAESRPLVNTEDLFEEDDLDEEQEENRLRNVKEVPAADPGIDNAGPVQSPAGAAAVASRKDVPTPLRGPISLNKTDLPPVQTSVINEDENTAMDTEPTPLGVSVKYWQNGKLVEQENKREYERDELERLVKKSVRERKGFNIFDIHGRPMKEKNYFDLVTNDGTRTIVLSRDKVIPRDLIAPAVESVPANPRLDTQGEIAGTKPSLTASPLQERSLADMAKELRAESDTDAERQRNRTKRREIMKSNEGQASKGDGRTTARRGVAGVSSRTRE